MTTNSENQDTRNIDILDFVGGNGRWQKLIFLVGFFCAIPIASHNLVMSFFAPNLDHWCARPHGMNISVEEWVALALPPQDHSCYQYKFDNFSNLSRNKTDTVPCKSWEYDDSVYTSTVLSKWDLVCEHQWLVSMSKSIFIGGYSFAVVVFGYLADKFGRRPTIITGNIIALLSATSCAFSTSFLMFAIFRFFIALGVAGVFNTAFVLLMEVVGPNYRPAYGLSINFGWCIGYVSLPLIAWMLRDWFWIQLFITLPSVFLIPACWLLPESPRWLLSQGRLNDAEEVLLKAAKVNGVEIVDGRKFKEILLQKSKEKESESNTGNVLDLLRTPGLWQKTLNLFYLWCAVAFVYYGISYNTNELAGDPFINFAVSGAIEFPANFICIFIIKSLGRRNPTSAFLMIGAVASLLMYPLPEDPWWLIAMVSLVGKFCITCSFGILYVFTAEIFPTVARNVGIGSASFCGRVGSIVAPFVRELGNATHPVMPQIIFGILSAIGGILVLFLPETNNCNVPDTLTQAAQVTSRKKTPNKAPVYMMMKEANLEKA